MPPCDEQLLERIRSGDADAFEALSARYRDGLWRHLEGIVRDAASADDLLQEVLLRLWTRAGSWDGRGPARAWLFRVATNLALNHLRTVRRRHEEPLARMAGVSGRGAGQGGADAGTGASAAPEQQVLWAERSRRLRRLLGAMPPDKRAVIGLAYEEDLAIRDVAERLAIPEGTAKSRLHYARKWLAGRWADEDREGDDV